MRNAPLEAAVLRFQKDLTSLIGSDSGKLGLAVSGGPDSLAMLLLAQAAGFECAAATVDHGLRPEGAQEAEFVASICGELNVGHMTMRLGAPSGGNISAWARDARYAALAEWGEAEGCRFLLTAHHADDQLETLIMRLNRGSGLAGLAGVRPRRGALVRPLLSWRKVELEEIVEHCGIVAIEDCSNIDDRFDRARLRKALSAADWLDPVAAATSAAALADAEEALGWASEAYFNRRVGESNSVISLDPRDLPKELLRRIILTCLNRVSPGANPRGEEVERLLSALSRGQTVSLAGVKCSGGAIWHFSLAPPRRTV